MVLFSTQMFVYYLNNDEDIGLTLFDITKHILRVELYNGGNTNTSDNTNSVGNIGTTYSNNMANNCGRHESEEYYYLCQHHMRNDCLFHADQNLNDDSQIYMQQHGIFCFFAILTSRFISKLLNNFKSINNPSKMEKLKYFNEYTLLHGSIQANMEIYVRLLIRHGFDIYQESLGSCDDVVEYSTIILQCYNSTGTSGAASHSNKSRLESSSFDIKKQETFTETFMLYLGSKNVFSVNNSQNNSRNPGAPASIHNNNNNNNKKNHNNDETKKR